ncbi:MAG: DUF92 domain-containing protein [archaeon]|jgi:uncharacterized protein (TIGR00297 family)
MELIELIIIISFLIIFSIFSYKKRLLDFEGILIANVVGLAAITYGPNPLLDFSAVVVFFIVGEVASNYPKRKHEQRGIWNVVGNSFPALICLILIMIYPEFSFIFELAFFGAVAAALADTLSSEVGYYSKSDPVLISTFKRVPRGTDGGITILGEFAGLVGGLIIAGVYFIFYQNFVIASILILSGLVGTNVDSLFGALFEIKKILNNTHVNLIGSSAGAIFAFIVGIIILLW